MVDIFIAIFLILDFVISIWNSYAAGFSLGLLKISKGPGWFRTFAVLGLAMGLLGEAYVIAIFLALITNAYDLISADAVALLLAYNYLIIGGLIIVLGIGMSAESVYVAAKRPGVWNVGTSVYNVFASVWNVFFYIRNFGVAMNIIKSEEREGRGQGVVLILAITAVIIAVLLSYIAYHFGRAYASGEYSGRVKEEEL